jgi:outer membrane biogenesis lipoprotein LolB
MYHLKSKTMLALAAVASLMLAACASTSSVDAVNAKADQALANSQQALQAAQQAQATAQQANQQTSMLYQRSLKK